MATEVELRMDRTTFTWRGQRIELSLPGLFNLENAIAAAEAVRLLGLDDDVIAAGLTAAELRQSAGRFWRALDRLHAEARRSGRDMRRSQAASEASRQRSASERAAASEARAASSRISNLETENRQLRDALAEAELKLEAITSIERSIRDGE